MGNTQQYYEKQLAEIRKGGNTSHTAFITDYIGGHGSNLGPVDPPVVGLVGEDEYYAQYFQNWDEINEFIEELQTAATKAWGSQYQHINYQEDRMTINPVTGDVGIGSTNTPKIEVGDIVGPYIMKNDPRTGILTIYPAWSNE